ncbi:hypothetical protein [Desulfosporosinus orientis]|uniref:hypothetical protein n=1 Tax=Desulfosporosinus orientis TaxID=1563 RepID=UPI0002E806DC|nr:hypothetical protein [Desulfosporosinus orientis]
MINLNKNVAKIARGQLTGELLLSPKMDVWYSIGLILSDAELARIERILSDGIRS